MASGSAACSAISRAVRVQIADHRAEGVAGRPVPRHAGVPSRALIRADGSRCNSRDTVFARWPSPSGTTCNLRRYRSNVPTMPSRLAGGRAEPGEAGEAELRLCERAGRDEDHDLPCADRPQRGRVRQCEEYAREASAGGDGLLHVFVPHATAGIAVMELHAASDADLLTSLAELLPADNRWQHAHGS